MKSAFFSLLALFCLTRPAAAASTSDPDQLFTTRAEWTGPLSSAATVDVNLGNSATAFVRAAYWQIAGSEPPPAFLSNQVNLLTTTNYWRRIDTVNQILNTVGPVKNKTYSDPWTSKPAFNTAPCKNVARDVGAVLMMFFNCPGGVNCGMEWANTHAYGMNAFDALYAPTGYMKANNTGFFERELMDARYAGLQFFLPNIYGPEITDGGVANMVTALTNISNTAIASQVKVGMFDDTSSWNSPYFTYAPWNSGPDMQNSSQTVTSAAKIFNTKWKPYFDAVPSQFWYRINGRPLIYFYNGGTMGNLINSRNVLESAKGQFYTYFGVTPWVAVDTAFFVSAGMAATADSRFTWKTVYNSQTNNLSWYNMNGVGLVHSMVKWDPVGRDTNGSITITPNVSSEIIKDPSYMSAALSNALTATVLVFATWNDLGEGTGINRNYDYYYQGNWLSPDYYMSMIRASQSGQSCPPVGSTPTFTATITATRTPVVTPTHGPLVADIEQVGSDDRTLWLPGAIVHYKDANGTTSNKYPWSATSGSAAGTFGSPSRSACYQGNLVASSPTAGVYPYSFIAFELSTNGAANAANGGTFADVTPYSPNHGIQFDYYAVAGVQYQVELNTQQVLDYSNYSYQFSAPTTGWHTQVVYFPGYGSPSFSQPAWGSPQVSFDATKVGSVLFQPVPQTVAVAYSLCVDNITFSVPAAATATPTPSPSPTRSPTPTRSVTASPSFTATITPSITPSATPSSTQTWTDSVTPSITQTALGSFTETPSFSASPSATATVTESPTYTASPTGSFTGTPSESSTVSPTLTQTATPSETPSASPTWTATSSITPGPSPTDSPVDTATATPSATRTQTLLPSQTMTWSATQSSSATPSSTETPLPTSAQSGTFTSTSTPTPTFTRTTVVSGPTATPSGSPVPLAIQQAWAAPNPQSGGGTLSLAVLLSAPADRFELKLYTPAYACLGSYSGSGSFGAGWNQVTLAGPSDVPAGLYFARLTAFKADGTKANARKTVKFMILP